MVLKTPYVFTEQSAWTNFNAVVLKWRGFHDGVEREQRTGGEMADVRDVASNADWEGDGNEEDK
jgi:hypothetical protein